MRRRGILLTTYGMVQHNAASLNHLPQDLGLLESGTDPVWHWVFLDEVPPQTAAPGDCQFMQYG